MGWGFVAEDPAFAELCEKIGVTFIGPSAEAMRKLGDKIGAKLIAEEVGVPVAPWSRGAVESLDAAQRAAAEIGYPLMLKATAGGGGRGIRVVRSDEELTEAYERTSLEAERAFGSGVVFLERLVTGARHVEVQVIADGQGTAWALGVRDCSVQRRNQKVIEESASPVLAPEQTPRAEGGGRAARAGGGLPRARARSSSSTTPARSCSPSWRSTPGCRSSTRSPRPPPTSTWSRPSSTWPPAAGSASRIPVEAGHAVEARLNAEDPDRDFAPSPGRIVRLALPSGPGVRVDTGVSEGDVIPADFDSMIAKIIAYGRTRDEALGRLRRAVAETTVIIEGGATNKSFLLDLLDQPEVIDASADTGWIDRVRAQGRLVSTRHSGIALAAAAIEAYEDEALVERQRLLSTAHGGRPQVQHESGRPIDLKLRGASYRVTVAQTGPHRFRVGIGEASTVDVELDRFDEHSRPDRWSTAGGSGWSPTRTGRSTWSRWTASRTGSAATRAACCARPHPRWSSRPRSRSGDEVEAGAPVLVLESMKMETVLRAPFKARLRECLVSVGSQVETGAPLLRLEPIGDEAAAEAAEAEAGRPGAAARADRPVRRGPGRARHRRPAQPAARLRPRPPRRAPGAGRLPGRPGRAGPTARCEDEVELLQVFADLSELSRNRPAGEETKADTRVHSPREYFHTYLQSLDVERAGAAGRRSATGSPGCSPTTASTTSSARPRWRRPSSGSSWRSSGPRPTSR